MRTSVFNVYADDSPEPGDVLVHNLLTGAAVVLDAGARERLRRLDAGDELSAEEREELSVDDLAAPDVAVLVESREAEEAIYQRWRDAIRDDESELDVMVATSFACNLRCTYCFEDKYMSGRTMRPETAEALLAWVRARAEEIRPQRLTAAFIGGEPLLHLELVERIGRGLQEIAASIGATPSFSIITNGTMLTRAVALRLRAVGVEIAQITLDGDGSTFSRTRPGKGSLLDPFPLVWSNLLAASEVLPIRIKGNYTPETAEGFAPLLRKMKEAGLTSARIPRVLFTPAVRTADTPEGSSETLGCTWSDSSPETKLALDQAVEAAGYRTASPLAAGRCTFHNRHHYAADPEGRLYKCGGFYGHPEWAIGDVSRVALDPMYLRMVEHDAEAAACGGCTYRPTCGGTCLAAAWTASGQMEGVGCELGFFEQTAGEYARRSAALKLAA